MPRLTDFVGINSRMWHTVHRNFGKLKKSDSGCIINFSGGGGNPVIQFNLFGSDPSAVNGFWACTNVFAKPAKNASTAINTKSEIRIKCDMSAFLSCFRTIMFISSECQSTPPGLGARPLSIFWVCFFACCSIRVPEHHLHLRLAPDHLPSLRRVNKDKARHKRYQQLCQDGTTGYA